MSQACRDSLLNCVDAAKGANAGLLLQRYLAVPVKDNADDSDKSHLEARGQLFGAARRATFAPAAAKPAGGVSAGVYREAFERRRAWATELGQTAACISFDMATPPHQRLVVGLGGASSYEIGLTLHHTYGTPLLPGSALKGLAAHYCNQVIGGAGSALLFGDVKAAGYVRFHDAWMAPESLANEKQNEGLLIDVMTPHHGRYYAAARYKDIDQLIPPTDFDDPNPISFLSVRGTFHFVMTCDDRSDPECRWLRRAEELLVRALGAWGIGGKTSSGYGRLVRPTAV